MIKHSLLKWKVLFSETDLRALPGNRTIYKFIRLTSEPFGYEIDNICGYWTLTIKNVELKTYEDKPIEELFEIAESDHLKELKDKK